MRCASWLYSSTLFLFLIWLKSLHRGRTCYRCTRYLYIYISISISTTIDGIPKISCYHNCFESRRSNRTNKGSRTLLLGTAEPCGLVRSVTACLGSEFLFIAVCLAFLAVFPVHRLPCFPLIVAFVHSIPLIHAHASLALVTVFHSCLPTEVVQKRTIILGIFINIK